VTQVPVGLEEIAGRARPVALATERVLPVASALESLLPGGLRRGSVVTVGGSVGVTSLALGLVAGASQAGSWCAAAVGDPPTLGLLAAAELGIVLERFPLVVVPSPAGSQGPSGPSERGTQGPSGPSERGTQGPSGPSERGTQHSRHGFAWVVAALLDAFDVVVAWPPAAIRAADARRLAARGRERGSALIVDGRHWPEAADLRLQVAGAAWHGVGRGHGRLEARQLEVAAVGRRAAARERRARVWI
jgi:hypothetical protein